MPRRLEYLPLADLHAALRNPKNHDDAGLEASMRRFGYTAPIEIDERTGRVISGHGRRARLLELDPRYVDVICRRWQEMTNITPTRPDGSPVDFITRGV